MGVFERCLSLWVLLCILTGIGLGSLATVVGVLIEVPVILSVVRIVNRTRGWYAGGIQTAPRRAN
jgi:ACR3 family arsenite efflux pump ArsB